MSSATEAASAARSLVLVVILVIPEMVLMRLERRVESHNEKTTSHLSPVVGPSVTCLCGQSIY